MILYKTVQTISYKFDFQYLNFSTMRLLLHVYQLHEEGPAQEEVEDEGDVPAASHWLLPNGKHRYISHAEQTSI